MSDEMVGKVKKLTGGLAKMNFFSSIFMGLMVIVSVYYGVTSALQHGSTWEVITIVNGVENVTTRSSFVNLGMSMIFCFMLITTIFSCAHLAFLNRVWDGVLNKAE